MADCYKLTAVSDFTKYVEALSDETGYEASRLQECKPVICQAIYGIGNPDISGIGVAIGYIIEIALGFTLAILLLLQTRLDPSLRSIPSQVLLTGLRSFFNAAAFFSIAVQIATISLLVQKDFGIATSDFGAIEAQIAQAVSVVSMLPLLYPALLLSGIDSSSSSASSSSPRSNPRLFLLNLAAALSFYPFLSRNLHAFGPGDSRPIGDGSGSDVSTADWAKVERLCFADGLDGLRHDALYAAIPPLELAASLVVYLATLWQMCGLVGAHYSPAKDQQKRHAVVVGAGRVVLWRGRVGEWFRSHRLWAALLMLVPLGLAVPLLWVIFHLRGLQEELARNMEEDYGGNNWGFGQIVAVVLYLPVAVDMLYRGRFGYQV
ncbi:unnamed protein product [Clonostachys solani]|uniref:Uncharacterized protein n=1 Tax=Clonostachys solani TaxID=160281 RepID=A0A9N9W3H9_9HYPO|nr:unnamed protein product [Clonostachys solani]